MNRLSLLLCMCLCFNTVLAQGVLSTGQKGLEDRTVDNVLDLPIMLKGENKTLRDISTKKICIHFWKSDNSESRKAIVEQLIPTYNGVAPEELFILGVNMDEKKVDGLKSLKMDQNRMPQVFKNHQMYADFFYIKELPSYIIIDVASEAYKEGSLNDSIAR